jgi:hypothetical protein
LKSGGGRTTPLYLTELRAGRLAGSEAMPDAAGGEGGHGAATLKGVHIVEGRNVKSVAKARVESLSHR